MNARQAPWLVSEPPLEPLEYQFARSPFVIGRSREAAVQIQHPLVELRHTVVAEREDGWWIVTASPSTMVNGVALHGSSHRLVSGDRLQLAGGATLTFHDGQEESVEVEQVTRPSWVPIQGRRRRSRSRNWRLPEWNLTTRKVMISIALVLLVVAGVFGWRARNRNVSVTAGAQQLSVPDAIVLDSLLSIAFDHIERGHVLLEADAKQTALEEFATGISTISTSSIRNHPAVQRKAAELRASVRDVYMARQLSVPGSMANATARAIAGKGLTAALTVQQFANAIQTIEKEFEDTWRTRLEVTGRDHAEHLSLYGSSSAIDVRTKTLTAEQVQSVKNIALRLGVRVKDFSQDAVLRAQAAAAMRAGRPDLAGTGLHMHLDRFANRSDRWTARPASSDVRQ